MRMTYRHETNAQYWDRRWSETKQDPDGFDNLDIYPIRFAEMLMTDKACSSLEIGCGLGRVLKYYYNRGFVISGIERSAAAIRKLKMELPAADLREGDVSALPYEDGTFDVVMAFGVFHNLETGLSQALAETARCLRPGGRFVISMRPDNIEMRINEAYWAWRNRRHAKEPKAFHKLMVTHREFVRMLAEAGLSTDQVLPSRNVPLLYRLHCLRAAADGMSEERERRTSGYRLNTAGRILDALLTRLFPFQTANVLVFIGHR